MKKASYSVHEFHFFHLATAALLFFCGAYSQASEGSPFIVGGEVVQAGDPVSLSTAALIVNTDQGEALCTVSLIAEDIAVTAAHCVEGADASDMVLAFGLDVLSGKPTTVPVVAAMANADYEGEDATGKDQHDIALVRFEGGIPEGYQTAKIMDDVSSLKKGQTVLLAGYGITDADTQDGAGVLRKVDVTIQNAKFGTTEIEFNQTDGKGACNGDSGGPAFVQQGSQLLLLALTNRSYPDNAPNDCMHDSIYTKISAYSDWIQSTETQLRSAQ